MQKWKQDSTAFIGESVVHLALGIINTGWLSNSNLFASHSAPRTHTRERVHPM